jgi:hypothetical protein
MMMQFPVPQQTKVDQPLLASRAAWSSPGYDDESSTAAGTPTRALVAHVLCGLGARPLGDGRHPCASPSGST